jgi:hypothetical protein
LKIYRVQIFIRLTLVFIHHPLPNVSITIRIPQRSLHSIFLALLLDAFARELSWRSIEYRLATNTQQDIWFWFRSNIIFYIRKLKKKIYLFHFEDHKSNICTQPKCVTKIVYIAKFAFSFFSYQTWVYTHFFFSKIQHSQETGQVVPCRVHELEKWCLHADGQQQTKHMAVWGVFTEPGHVSSGVEVSG